MNPAAPRSLPAPVWDHALKMRRLVLPLVALVVVGIVVVGLTQAGGQKKPPDRLTLSEMQRSLQGAPPQP